MYWLKSRNFASVFFSVLIFTGCGGNEQNQNPLPIIPGPLPFPLFPNSSADDPNDNAGSGDGTTIPTCEAYATTQQLDLDQDGALDIAELNGVPDPSNSSIKYRSDPLLADTDGDGKNDHEEVTNRRATGVNVADLLTSAVSTNPAQRDWFVLVYARGGSNGAPIQSNDQNGWNSYGGVGGCTDNSEQCQKKKLKKLPGETEISIRYINNSSIVDRQKLLVHFTNYPNLISPELSPGSLNINCWSGGSGQEGCIGPGGQNTTASSMFPCVNNGHPSMPSGGYSSNYFVNSCSTYRNSLIMRFNSTGAREMVNANFGPLNNSNCSWCFPFRVGSVASGQQTSISSVPIQSFTNEWKYIMNSDHDTYNQPLLRMQDQNSTAAIGDNGGFLAVVVRFWNENMNTTYKMPVSNADNASVASQKRAYFQHVLNQPQHAGKCTIPN